MLDRGRTERDGIVGSGGHLSRCARLSEQWARIAVALTVATRRISQMPTDRGDHKPQVSSRPEAGQSDLN